MDHYVHDCFICKKRITPVPPLMAALPRHRLEATQPPFTNTGIDYFGPMNVVIFRRSVKRYGLLFTCLVTRAVHIEITLDGHRLICYGISAFSRSTWTSSSYL